MLKGHSSAVFALVALASTQIGCRSGQAKKEQATLDVAALPPLPDEHQVVLHGPHLTIDQHCNAFMTLAAAEAGVDTAQLDYGCRTDVRAQGERIKDLREQALEGGFLRAKLYETGYVTDHYVGQVRLALQLDSGWYVSDGLIDVVESSEKEGGGLTSGTLTARALHDAKGLEVVFVATSPADSKGAVTVACRIADDGTPDCVSVESSDALSPEGAITLADTKYRAWR